MSEDQSDLAALIDDPSGTIGWSRHLARAIHRQDHRIIELAARRLLVIESHKSERHHDHGVALRHIGRVDEAARAFTNALIRNPADRPSQAALGEILSAGGRWAEAVPFLAAALCDAPGLFHRLYNIAAALQNFGAPTQAAIWYRRATSINPAEAAAWFSLGVVSPRGRTAALRRTLVLRPADAAAWALLADSTAADSPPLPDNGLALIRALQSAPHDPAIHYLDARIAHQAGADRRSDQALQRALALAPAATDSLTGLANLARLAGDITRAQRFAGRACAITPGSPTAQIALITADADAATWHRRATQRAWIDRALDDSSAALPLPAEVWRSLAYQAPFLDLPAARHREILHRAAHATRPDFGFAPSSATTRNRLRVGYLSPNFGDQPMGHVTCRLFAAHDRRAIDVFVYSLIDRSRDATDHFARIRQGAEHFVDLSAHRGAAAAARIAQDELDILVDLDGYMSGVEIGTIPAYRPARLVMHWLGHGGGLGADFIDYLIGDSYVLPAGCDHGYRESLLRLPRIWHPTEAPPLDPPNLTRADQGLPQNGFVFASFNHPKKIDPMVFAAWMAILRATPGSVLWLHGFGSAAATVNLRHAAATEGVAPDRLIFADRLPSKGAHLARMALADLFLDCFTVNAATTALDALWAGLPILTWAGETFFNRMSAAMLRQIGLDALIAPTREDYVRRAVALTEGATLARLRAGLAAARATSALFDIDRFARDLERGYRMAWARYVAGLPPAAIDVPEAD